MEKFFKTGPCLDYAPGDEPGLLLPESKPPFTVERDRVYIQTPAGRAMIDPAMIASVMPAGINQTMLIFKGGTAVGVPLASNVVIEAVNAIPPEPSLASQMKDVTAELIRKINSIGTPPIAPIDRHAMQLEIDNIEGRAGSRSPGFPTSPRASQEETQALPTQTESALRLTQDETHQPTPQTDEQRAATSASGNIPPGVET